MKTKHKAMKCGVFGLLMLVLCSASYADHQNRDFSNDRIEKIETVNAYVSRLAAKLDEVLRLLEAPSLRQIGGSATREINEYRRILAFNFNDLLLLRKSRDDLDREYREFISVFQSTPQLMSDSQMGVQSNMFFVFHSQLMWALEEHCNRRDPNFGRRRDDDRRENGGGDGRRPGDRDDGPRR